MNGANADPWANTKSAPINTMTIMIGRSHHFFLTLRNAQNSRARLGFAMLSPLTVSELMCQIAPARLIVLTINPKSPVPFRRRHGVVAEQSHREADRRKHNEIRNPHE